jgi:hypothetical protein
VLQYKSGPIALAVCLPLALLGVWWRSWLGWPGGGPRREVQAPGARIEGDPRVSGLPV